MKYPGPFASLLMAAALTTSGLSQTNPTGTIKGKIIDQSTKQNLPGTSVFVKGNPLGGISDTGGVFVIKNVPEGFYSLRVVMTGYQEKTVNDLRVSRNKTNYVEIELEEVQQTLGEVEVTSYQYENNPLTPVSMYSFSREEIARNPGAQGDIFRAIGMLPGVTSSGGAFSAIAVRGQGTRDNVYIVDDIPIFSLAHLDGSPNGFDDPNGGRFSIFAPRVIDNAQFQGGGFAAQYGRRSSSYLGLGIKEGNKESVTLDGQLDLLGGTLNYDGPSFVLKNTSLFISARYQDFTKLVRLVNLKDLGIPKYQDLIFKSTTQIDAKNKLSLIAIYSPETFVRDTSNVRADANLNRLFILDRKSAQSIFGIHLRTLTGERSYWKNVIYYSATRQTNSYGKAFPPTDSTGELLPNNLIGFESGIRKIRYSESRLGYRTIFTYNFSHSSRLTAGVEVDRSTLVNQRTLSRTDTSYIFGATDFRPTPTTYYALIRPDFFDAEYNAGALNWAAYVDYSAVFLKRLTLNLGVRYDYTGFSDQHTLAPRLSGSWQLNASSSINFSSGLYYQDPAYSAVADQPKTKPLKNEQTAQYILGYKKHVTPELKLTIEGWYKSFTGLIVRPVNGSSEQNNKGTGWATGLDASLTKRLSRNFHGQVGYSYMVSKRNDHNGLGDYDFTFSQPHAVNILASYKVGRHWIFSGKFRYSTGKPTYNYIIHNNVLNSPNTIRYSQEIIAGQKRLPDFISLDLRIDYRFQIKKLGLTAFLDVVDVLNRTNAYQELFNPITGKTFYDGIAIFPMFGLKFEF